MDDQPKFCIDCLNHRVALSGLHLCDQPTVTTTTYDLVTGEALDTVSRTCSYQRTHPMGLCGRLATLWEPKP